MAASSIAYTLVAGSHRESERFDAPSSRRDAVIGGTPKYPRAKNAVYLWAIMLHGRKREKVGMYTQRSDHNPVGYNHTSGERERSPTCQDPKDLGRKRSRASHGARKGKDDAYGGVLLYATTLACCLLPARAHVLE